MHRFARFLLPLLLISLMPLLMASSHRERGGGYVLELDGITAGWLFSVEGGHAVADVVTEKMGGDYLQKKHIGNVKYEDISLQCSTGMSKALYEWIQASVSTPVPKNGAIIAVDADGREISRREFHDALVTEIGMPALDAASKDAARMTLRLHPAWTGHDTSHAGQPVDAPAAKRWSPANFRLRLAGLDEVAARVNKIEALVIKQKVTENAVGEQRDYEREPASVEVPNLVITFDAGVSETMYQWHEDFAVTGNNGDDQEKAGTLEYLAPDNQTVLFSIDMKNLGVFKVAPDKMEAGAESIRRVKAELYVEAMSFSFSQ